MTGIWTNAGTSPANRVFIFFHRSRFGEEASLKANNPKWVLALDCEMSSDEDKFLLDHYEAINKTGEDCIADLTLYRLKDNDSADQKTNQ